MIKYTFSQATTEAVVDDFINKMTQHLVPKYFSRIEKAYTADRNEPYIQGYDDEDVLIFKLRTWIPESAYTSEPFGILFYNKTSGTWMNVRNYNGSSYRIFLLESYISTGGIFFRFYRNGSYIDPTVLCLDDKNRTAFLNVSSENTSGSAATDYLSTYTQVGSLSYVVYHTDRDNVSGSYYLMPFLTYDGTLKRVWCPIIEQYNLASECMRIMQLDNKDYFVMPGFLIEDF